MIFLIFHTMIFGAFFPYSISILLRFPNCHICHCVCVCVYVDVKCARIFRMMMMLMSNRNEKNYHLEFQFNKKKSSVWFGVCSVSVSVCVFFIVNKECEKKMKSEKRFSILLFPHSLCVMFNYEMMMMMMFSLKENVFFLFFCWLNNGKCFSYFWSIHLTWLSILYIRNKKNIKNRANEWIKKGLINERIHSYFPNYVSCKSYDDLVLDSWFLILVPRKEEEYEEKIVIIFIMNFIVVVSFFSHFFKCQFHEWMIHDTAAAVAADSVVV